MFRHEGDVPLALAGQHDVAAEPARAIFRHAELQRGRLAHRAHRHRAQHSPGQRCTALPDTAGQNRLQNGLQIFPGGVPIYRDGRLVGAIGVSGDGIDQDDMTAFLGVANASARVSIRNADAAIRADQVVVPNSGGVRLRYVSCPFAPFLDTADQNVCSGK